MGKSIVRVEGFRECRESLQQLSNTVQRNVGRRSLMAPANVVAAAMKSKAPISNDPHDPTPGSLRDSVRAAPDKSRRGRSSAIVIAEDPAAVPTEFGTFKDPAQGWARRAVGAVKAAALAAFGAALRLEVDSAVARVAKRGAK